MHDLVRRIKMLEYALKAERSVLPPPLSLPLLPPSFVYVCICLHNLNANMR